MKLIIDRFEGDYAICEKENRKMMNILKAKLPLEVKEGDVLIKIGDFYKIDIEETKKRKAAIEELTKDLWK